MCEEQAAVPPLLGETGSGAVVRLLSQQSRACAVQRSLQVANRGTSMQVYEDNSQSKQNRKGKLSSSLTHDEQRQIHPLPSGFARLDWPQLKVLSPGLPLCANHS